jgi:hypothetical protein
MTDGSRGVVYRSFPRRAGLAIVGCASLALAVSRPSAAEDQQQKCVALITRASQLQNLMAQDVGPFRLRAHVKLFGLVEGTREGEYLRLALSPEQWFEQVRFPGYSELHGLYEGQSWRKRNVIDKPFRFYEVSKLFDLESHLTLAPDVEIRKLMQKDIGGTDAFCIEASPTRDLWQKDSARRAAISEVGISKDSQVTLCFDAASGALMSATYSSSLPRYEYEGQVTLGNKVFPKVLRCYEGKELVVEATVLDLAAQKDIEPTGFAPPAGANKWPYCESLEMPKLIEKKALSEDLLSHAKATHSFGTIVCLAEVATDGSIHDLAAIQWRGMLGQLVREAVKKWRYKPATCNGVPVPAEIYIAYTFTP